MAGHKSFRRAIYHKLPAQRRQRIERKVQATLREMLLSELRKLAGLTQAEVAGRMGVKQSALSRMESQEDIQVSTLVALVRALGGELEIIAKLPGEQVSISQFRQSA